MRDIGMDRDTTQLRHDLDGALRTVERLREERDRAVDRQRSLARDLNVAESRVAHLTTQLAAARRYAEGKAAARAGQDLEGQLKDALLRLGGLEKTVERIQKDGLSRRVSALEQRPADRGYIPPEYERWMKEHRQKADAIGPVPLLDGLTADEELELLATQGES